MAAKKRKRRRPQGRAVRQTFLQPKIATERKLDPWTPGHFAIQLALWATGGLVFVSKIGSISMASKSKQSNHPDTIKQTLCFSAILNSSTYDTCRISPGIVFPNRNCQFQKIENNWKNKSPWLKRKVNAWKVPPKSNRAKQFPFFPCLYAFQLYLLPTVAAHLGLQGKLRASIPQTTTKHNQA